MAYQLLTKMDSDPVTEGYVDKYDFYIFPVVNPDGESISRVFGSASADYRDTNSCMW